jgi:hypothetical protein
MYPVAFAVVSILANGKDLSTGEIIKSEAGFKNFSRSTASLRVSRLAI